MVSTLPFSRTKLCNHSNSVHGNWANHICVPTTWWLDQNLRFTVYSLNLPLIPQYPSIQNLAWWSMRINTSVSMLRMTIAGVLSRHTPTTKFAGNMTCVSASSCPHLYGILQCTGSYHRVIWWSRDSLLSWCLSTRFGAWFYTWTTFQLLHTNSSAFCPCITDSTFQTLHRNARTWSLSLMNALFC